VNGPAPASLTVAVGARGDETVMLDGGGLRAAARDTAGKNGRAENEDEQSPPGKAQPDSL
jgi:hypothetical protein